MIRPAFFDAATYLLIGVQENPGAELLLSDYREIEGVKFPRV